MTKPKATKKRDHCAETLERKQPLEQLSEKELKERSDQLLEAAATRQGRPSTYTHEKATEILQRLASGETLTAICEDQHMPARFTVYWWTYRYPDFGNALNRARTFQGESWGEDAVATVKADPYEGLDQSQRDSHNIAKVRTMHARNKGDILLRAAGRRDPERWGDRPAPGAGVQVVINTNLGLNQELEPGRMVVTASDDGDKKG